MNVNEWMRFLKFWICSINLKCSPQWPGETRSDIHLPVCRGVQRKVQILISLRIGLLIVLAPRSTIKSSFPQPYIHLLIHSALTLSKFSHRESRPCFTRKQVPKNAINKLPITNWHVLVCCNLFNEGISIFILNYDIFVVHSNPCSTTHAMTRSFAHSLTHLTYPLTRSPIAPSRSPRASPMGRRNK